MMSPGQLAAQKKDAEIGRGEALRLGATN
jgi:hypothetical protein